MPKTCAHTDSTVGKSIANKTVKRDGLEWIWRFERKREGFVVVEVVVNDSIVVEALDGDDLLTRRRPCT